MQAHGFEHRALEIFGVRLFLAALEDITHHGDPGVRIFSVGAGRINQRGGLQALYRRRDARLIRIEIMAHRWLADQAGAVRHQLAQRDLFSKRVARMKIGQVVGDRRVEIQFATLHKLHHADVSKKLGNRADTVDGPGCGGGFLVGIGQSKTPRPDDLLVVDQRNGNRG